MHTSRPPGQGQAPPAHECSLHVFTNPPPSEHLCAVPYHRPAHALADTRKPRTLNTLPTLYCLPCSSLRRADGLPHQQDTTPLSLPFSSARVSKSGSRQWWGHPPAHVLNCVLVPQPVAALDCVICMPPPVVLGHVAQCGIDAALGRHCVGAGGEQLGQAPAGWTCNITGHCSRLVRVSPGTATSKPGSTCAMLATSSMHCQDGGASKTSMNVASAATVSENRQAPLATDAASLLKRAAQADCHALAQTHAVLSPLSAKPTAALRPAPPAPTTMASYV